VVVTDFKQIATHYLQTWFTLDFLTSLPLAYVSAQGATGYYISLVSRASRLAKLLRLVRFIRLSNSKELALYLTPSMIRLINTMLFLFWMWHVIACTFWYIATYEGLGSTGWTPDASHQMNSRTLNYLLSVQWTLQTTFSFGAPSLPETYIEAVFTIISVLIGIFMNAYVIGSAGSALQSMDAEKIQRRQQLDRIITYMKRRKLPSYFQRIILDFYEYFGEKSSEENILTDLPGPIQTRLSLLLNREVVKNIPVLKQLELNTIISLMQLLTTSMYLPGEFVYKAGDAGDYLYFVKTGQLEQVLPNGSTTVMSLLRGDMFGQMALTMNGTQISNVRAVVYSEVLQLDAESYDELAKQSEKFVEIVEREAIKEEAMISKAAKNISRFGNKLSRMASDEQKFSKEKTLRPKDVASNVVNLLWGRR
jgi:CRP-like cAMP-binding protein